MLSQIHLRRYSGFLSAWPDVRLSPTRDDTTDTSPTSPTSSTLASRCHATCASRLTSSSARQPKYKALNLLRNRNINGRASAILVDYCRECVQGGTHTSATRPYDWSTASVFAAADVMNQSVRGHNLLAQRNPGWLTNGNTPPELSTILQEHITTVVGHYGNRAYCWDA